MKIVLSRKCFDSSYGGFPSPILPDGQLLPLPIPSSHDTTTFSDVDFGVDIDPILRDLSGGKYTINSTVHLDPDLSRWQSRRKSGWRPTLGQTGAAQSHLQSMEVGYRDVFLFFGWFRRVEMSKGRWRFARDAPNLHVMFGWLEVEKQLPIVVERQLCIAEYNWIADHPHVANPAHYTDRRNTLYVAFVNSRFATGSLGGGRFREFSEDLCLTKFNESRSVWSLPSWFFPANNRRALSYHSSPERWKLEGDRVTLKSVAKGQEFVLDASHYPEAEPWIRQLIAEHA